MEIKLIVKGLDFYLALKHDGTIWAWGENYFGQLGDGTKESRNIPVHVTNMQNIKQILEEEIHSLALKSDSSMWSWGDNIFEKLGYMIPGEGVFMLDSIGF